MFNRTLRIYSYLFLNYTIRIWVLPLLCNDINYASTSHYTGATDHPDCIRNNVTTEYHLIYASVTKVSSGMGVSSGTWLSSGTWVSSGILPSGRVSSGTQLSSDLLPIWYQFVKICQHISVLEGKFPYYKHIGFILTYIGLTQRP